MAPGEGGGAVADAAAAEAWLPADCGRVNNVLCFDLKPELPELLCNPDHMAITI